MNINAETGVKWPQTRETQSPELEETRKDAPLQFLEGARPSRHVHFELIASTTKRPLSTTIPIIAQWTWKKSCHDGRNSSCAWPQQDGLPLTKTNLITITAEFPAYQQQRPTLNTRYGITPQCYVPATWWDDSYTGLLPSQKGQNFAITGKDTHSGYGFAFSDAMLLPKLPSTDLQKAMSTVTVSHSIGFDQRTYFIAKEIQQWVHDHGICWSDNVPPPFRRSQLDRKTKWVFEDSVIAPAYVNTLQEWSDAPKKAVHVPNQHLICGAFLP